MLQLIFPDDPTLGKAEELKQNVEEERAFADREKSSNEEPKSAPTSLPRNPALGSYMPFPHYPAIPPRYPFLLNQPAAATFYPLYGALPHLGNERRYPEVPSGTEDYNWMMRYLYGQDASADKEAQCRAPHSSIPDTERNSMPAKSTQSPSASVLCAPDDYNWILRYGPGYEGESTIQPTPYVRPPRSHSVPKTLSATSSSAAASHPDQLNEVSRPHSTPAPPTAASSVAASLQDPDQEANIFECFDPSTDLGTPIGEIVKREIALKKVKGLSLEEIWRQANMDTSMLLPPLLQFFTSCESELYINY